MIVLMFMHRW